MKNFNRYSTVSSNMTPEFHSRTRSSLSSQNISEHRFSYRSSGLMAKSDRRSIASVKFREFECSDKRFKREKERKKFIEKRATLMIQTDDGEISNFSNKNSFEEESPLKRHSVRAISRYPAQFSSLKPSDTIKASDEKIKSPLRNEASPVERQENRKIAIFRDTKIDILRRLESTLSQQRDSLCLRKKHPNIFLIIFPDEQWKQIWDIILALLLIYSITVTPYVVAFIERTSPEMKIFDYVVDGFFLCDVALNFLSAYYDEKNELILDRKKIFLNYFFGWFPIDLFSSLPLEAIIESQSTGGLNSLGKLVRLPRIYKLFKMTRLMRIFKILREKTRMAIFFNEIFGSKAGSSRLPLTLISILLFCHIVACIWYLLDELQETSEKWSIYHKINNLEPVQKYVACIYFVIQTLVTVGYGDLAAINTSEQIFCVFLMLMGVFSYTFMVSSLTLIISSVDVRREVFFRKMAIMQIISMECNVPQELRSKIKLFLKSGIEFEFIYQEMLKGIQSLFLTISH